MKNLTKILGLLAMLTLVSCGSGSKGSPSLEEAEMCINGDEAACEKIVETPVAPPVVEPPVVQISMDNIQGVWFEGVEIEFFNAAPQGNDFYTEFKRFDEYGETRLSFFDNGIVYINKYSNTAQHIHYSEPRWEIRDNKLFIDNAEFGVSL